MLFEFASDFSSLLLLANVNAIFLPFQDKCMPSWVSFKPSLEILMENYPLSQTIERAENRLDSNSNLFSI